MITINTYSFESMGGRTATHYHAFGTCPYCGEKVDVFLGNNLPKKIPICCKKLGEDTAGKAVNEKWWGWVESSYDHPAPIEVEA